MKARTLIALALIAVALASYIACGERQGKSGSAARAAQKRLVRDFDAEKVSAIELRQQGAASVRLERAGKSWKIRGTRSAARADKARVARLLSALEFLEPLRSLDSAKGRGLDPPKHVLTVERRGAKAVRLELGQRDASGKAVYARYHEQVVVLPASFAALLEGGADALRDREVVALSEREIGEVSIVREGAFVLLAPRGRGYRMSYGKVGKPGEALPTDLVTRAASAATQRLVAALASLRVRRFDAKPLTSLATINVIVRPRDKKRAEVLMRIGGACAGGGGLRHIARQIGNKGPWEPLCVDGEDLTPLGASMAALVKSLVDGSLLGAPRLADIKQLEIARGKEKVVVRRDGGDLLLDDKDSGKAKADPPAIKALFDALARHDAAARAPAKGEIEALERAWAARLRLTFEGGASELLTFGTPSGKVMLVRRDDEKAVIEVPAGALALLEPDPLRFRSRVVLAVPQLEVKRVAITRAGEREQLERDAEGFKVVKPTEVRADRAAVRALLDKLSALRCTRFFEKRGAVAGLTVEAEAQKKYSLALSAAKPGAACRGRVAGLPDFELDAKDCALLSRRLARSRVVPLRSGKLTRLSLERPGSARLALERDGERWTVGKQPAKASEVAQLVAAIAALRGEVSGYRQRPSTTARATLRVRHESGQPIRVLRVYGAGKGGVLSVSDAAAGVTWRVPLAAWARVEQAFARQGL
ncbi:MAG: DUF4340 domain-containing protein [Myxococcales bacterium]|nr:DUF4340 domain-containing protein [Myxococcales bacterium]